MKYFLIAGEASGDLHASHLMHAIKAQDPQAEFMFLGGDLMQAEGGTMVRHYRNMAFMGFVSVIMNLKTVLNNIKKAQEALLEFKPDKLILIDYPGFNLKMAKYAKSHLSNTSTVYYISPKLWAWKTYRIKGIKKYIDTIYTIFPFETEFYKQYDYHVTYVGNPSYDEVSTYTHNNTYDRDKFTQDHQLDTQPIIALLPGSRKQEISKCLPTMIESASAFTDHQIVIAGAPDMNTDFYAEYAGTTPIIFDQTYRLLQHSDAAIVNSGTATLETALIGTPQVVVYKVFGGRFTYSLKDIFIKTKYISLVNIIAQQEVVKELIAHLFNPEQTRKELDQILNNPTYRHNMISQYDKIRAELGKTGGNAAENAAKAISLMK